MLRTTKPAPRERTFTRDQNAIRKEFITAYGFTADQIGFDGKSLDPIFDFDALNVLANTLADIPGIVVGMEGFNQARGLANSFCKITLHGRRTRKIFGVAVIGEEMHDGSKIRDMIRAINVSRARALRTGLRSIGFDPVKFHKARKEGTPIDLLGSAAATRDRNTAEIHVLAGPRGLNFIKKNGDRTQYENLLASYFQGHTSSKDLTDQEHAEWLGMLRGWARGVDRAEPVAA